MAALDFPASPTNGQVYGAYTYNSTKGAWNVTPVSTTSVPSGGAANSFLSKVSTTDYATQWTTTLAVANGGTGATTGAGLVPIIPTSVSNTGGTSSFSSTTGKITLTGSSTALVVDGIFSSAYTNYKMIFNPTAGGDYLYVRSVNAGTVNSGAGAYIWQMHGAQGGTVYSGSGFFATSDTAMKTAALSGVYGTTSFDVMSPFVSTLGTRIQGQSNWAQSTPTIWQFMGGVTSTGTTTGLQLFPATGTFSGTLSFYGYKD